MRVLNKFGNEQQFKNLVNPSAQTKFGKKPEAAFLGDYPTLEDINYAYGSGFASEWLIPHIDNLSAFSGAKNLEREQMYELVNMIAAAYPHLKITEILLFFFWFKTGRYGRFYGTADPILIMEALRKFNEQRASNISEAMEKTQQRPPIEATGQSQTMTYQQYLEYCRENNLPEPQNLSKKINEIAESKKIT